MSRLWLELESFQKVEKEERKKIIERFNGLEDYNLQNIYLKGLIDSREIKRVGPQGRNGVADGMKEQKRKCLYEYFVHIKEQMRVKVTSRNILSIRNKRCRNFYIFILS